MSDENVEAFRRLVEAVSRGDLEAARRHVAEDALLIPRRAGIEGAYRGHDGLRTFFENNAQLFEIWRADYPEMRDLGDRVLAIGTIHIRGRGSGVETDLPSAGLASFAGGKATKWEDFGERKLALEAAGLPAE
jgi:ketosteroid isomerase-like protein